MRREVRQRTRHANSEGVYYDDDDDDNYDQGRVCCGRFEASTLRLLRFAIILLESISAQLSSFSLSPPSPPQILTPSPRPHSHHPTPRNAPPPPPRAPNPLPPRGRLHRVRNLRHSDRNRAKNHQEDGEQECGVFEGRDEGGGEGG